MRTYSDRASPIASKVVPRLLDFVGVTEVQLLAKDKYNNTLSDFGVKARAHLARVEERTAPEDVYSVWDNTTLYKQMRDPVTG